MRVKTDQPSDDAWKQAHLAMLVRLGKRQIDTPLIFAASSLASSCQRRLASYSTFT